MFVDKYSQAGLRFCSVQGIDHLPMTKDFYCWDAIDPMPARQFVQFIGVEHGQHKAAAEFAGEAHQARHEHHAGAGARRPVIHQDRTAGGILQYQAREIFRADVEYVRQEGH